MDATIVQPFYQDWKFWSFVTSGVAIFLSQMPHVSLWFRRAKVELETYSRIHITHKIGKPQLQLHLILSNDGGRVVKIKSLVVKVSRDGKEIGNLPAQNYLQSSTDSSTVLFTSFSLKPKEEWAHIINFMNYFSRSEEKKYKEAESKLTEDILGKRKYLEDKNTLVESTNELTAPFVEMFNQNFIWTPGEYDICVSVITLNGSANITKRYRFTLFESDSAELSKIKDDYKHGDSINWHSGKHPGVILELIEA